MFAFRQLTSMMLVIWLAATFAFLAMRLLPGDAIEGQLIHSGAGENAIRQQRASLGLDKPLLEQYLRFLMNLLRGDLGYSLLDGLPVSELIAQRFIPTVTLTFGALVIALFWGLILGLLGAVDFGWGVSTTVRTITSLSFAAPVAWTGILVIYGVTFLGSILSIDTQFGNQPWLPMLVLGFHTSGAIARVTQVNVHDALTSAFVQTARAKGLPEWLVIWRHALRAGLLPVITVIALQAGFLFGGTVITENLFVRPGIGQLLLTRTLQQDYPVVQGIVILAAVVYTLLNTAADILYRLLDPRVIN